MQQFDRLIFRLASILLLSFFITGIAYGKEHSSLDLVKNRYKEAIKLSSNGYKDSPFLFQDLFNSIDSIITFDKSINKEIADSLALYGIYSQMEIANVQFYSKKRDYFTPIQSIKNWRYYNAEDYRLRISVMLFEASFMMKEGKHLEALNIFLKGSKMAEKANDYLYMGRAKYYIGRILTEEGDFAQSNIMLDSALSSYKKANYDIGLSAIYNAIAMNYKDLEKYDSSLVYYKKSLSHFPDTSTYKRKMNFAALNNNIGNLFLIEEMPDSAYSYIIASNNIYRQINNYLDIIHSNNNLARYYAQIGNKDMAIETYLKNPPLVKESKYRNLLLPTYRGLSDIYEKGNETKKALKFLKLYNQINDSIYHQNKLKNIEDKLHEEELEKRSYQYELLLLKNKMENRQKIGLGIFLLLSSAIMGAIMKNQKKTIKKKKLIIELEKSLAKEQLATKELKKNELEFQLKFEKDKFVKAQSIYQEQISIYNTLNEKINALKNEEGYLRVKQIKELQNWINHSINSLTKNDQMNQKLEELEDSFTFKIEQNFPNLNENERKLLGLVKMDLSNKEIATIQNTSVKAIEMKKYRLRKKIGLEKNQSFKDLALSDH
ncbi:hypothetical protein AUTU_01480 [Aureibacter tunicatorum]|nr:hypothetical protein AUTU_01480 [Aureibacter tunicatorum]